MFVCLDTREFVKAIVAGRLGDPTPRQFGRRTLNPKPMFDPFGTGILPGLILILVASGSPILPPYAYAKPMPLEPSRLHRPERDSVLVALAGPAANLAIATLAGIVLRLGLGIEIGTVAVAFLYTSLIMCVLNLMPIPGLDGSTILARFLPPSAREVYVGLDKYLVLFMLLVFFLFAGPLLGIVRGLAGGLCNLVAPAGVCGILG